MGNFHIIESVLENDWTTKQKEQNIGGIKTGKLSSQVIEHQQGTFLLRSVAPICSWIAHVAATFNYRSVVSGHKLAGSVMSQFLPVQSINKKIKM